MRNLDLVSNVEADMADLISGRIADVEHLHAVDLLMDILCDIEETARNIASQDTNSIYKFVNGLSKEQLDEKISRLKDIEAEIKEILNG